MMDTGSVIPDVIDVSGEGSITIYQRKAHMAESDGKTLAQQYYEEVEALKADGTSNADAIRRVAEQHGKKENAVRGGLHQYKSKLNGGTYAAPRRQRPPKESVDDLINNARQSLERAAAMIDQEVADAKAELDAAQARYDEVVTAVKDRKADIARRLKAMA